MDYKLDGDHARSLLASLDIVPTTDFLALHSTQVNQLVEFARSIGYRRSRKAHDAGYSTGRAFHAFVCRQAATKVH